MVVLSSPTNRRPRMAQVTQVTQDVTHALARLRRDPLADLPIAGHADQLLRDCGRAWRDRLLTPLVTLRLFLLQVLAGNCAVAALRQLSGIDFAPSSYCDARKRLPMELLQSLLRWTHALAQNSPGVAEGAVKKIGPRVLIADGSSYSVADTPELRRQFGLPPGVAEGVGYPMGK